MSSDNNSNLIQWLERTEEYALPTWDILPSIPLYMDQIIMFTGETLDLFENSEKQPLLTSSMINNYVKNGLVEHPVHKKYSKEHLSKLIMTSMLKQVLSIQDIGILFGENKDAKQLYEIFTAAQDTALHETVSAIDTQADSETLRVAALKLAAEANARRAVAERILIELANPEAEHKGKKASKK